MITQRFEDGCVINITHRGISITRSDGAGTASADHIDGGTWWISRAFVRPAHRNAGLGSLLLQKMKTSFATVRLPDEVLLVCPGGYEGPLSRQQAFYVKNGFRKIVGIDPDDNLFAWVPYVPPHEELARLVREQLKPRPSASRAEDTFPGPAPEPRP